MELLQPNQMFARRYRIERFLARGGMGAVFVGEHVATDQRVAVKVLWPHVLQSRDAVEKFQLEAKVAGRVQSDHIVRVIDAGYDDESQMPFLVMELLEGKTLESIVKEGGPLGRTETVRYLRQVATGLDKAHGYVSREGQAQPIVHRDLKPENLFVTQRDSGEPLVKILDFGIAKVLAEGAKVSQELKGTPLYMAYEQATGSLISPQTDIWALGLIAFWLLTGRSYWMAASTEGAAIAQLFAEVLTLPLAPASVRIRELGAQPPWPQSFDAWFFRCVDRDPGARFGSAREAVWALADALGLRISAPPPSAQVTPLSAPTPTLPSPVAPLRIEVSGALAQPDLTESAAGALAHTTPRAIPTSHTKTYALLTAIAAVAVAGLGLAIHTQGRATAAPPEVGSSAESAPAAAPALPSAMPLPEAAASLTDAAAPEPRHAPAPTRAAPVARAAPAMASSVPTAPPPPTSAPPPTPKKNSDDYRER